MVAMETVDFALSAAAAGGFQAFAAGTNQSAVIRGTNQQASAMLIDAGGFVTTQANLTIRSPRLHDIAEGILMDHRGGEAEVTWPFGATQQLYGQDQLIVGGVFTAAPGAASVQHATLQVYYNDLGGIAAQLRHWAEVQPNIVELTGVTVNPTSGAAPGSWGAGVAINSVFDLLKANQYYAILGFATGAVVSAVGVQGPDLGNLIVGGPNSVAVDDTRNYFKRLSDATGLATIPVINSANKGGTNVLITSSVAATLTPVTLAMARLSS